MRWLWIKMIVNNVKKYNACRQAIGMLIEWMKSVWVLINGMNDHHQNEMNETENDWTTSNAGHYFHVDQIKMKKKTISMYPHLL